MKPYKCPKCGEDPKFQEEKSCQKGFYGGFYGGFVRMVCSFRSCSGLNAESEISEREALANWNKEVVDYISYELIELKKKQLDNN